MHDVNGGIPTDGGTGPPPGSGPSGAPPGSEMWPGPGFGLGAAARERPPVRRQRRWPMAAVGVGLAAGTALGAGVIASAVTSSGSTPAASTAATSSGGSNGSSSGSSASGTATTPPAPDGPGPRGKLGLGFGGARVLHGVFTVVGPNGSDETLQEQTGTVSAIAGTVGNTWSMTVTSSDGTAITYVIDTGTSVNGGESGVSSISKGDTVHVLALVSNDTNEAKQVTDTTVLQANGQSWRPSPPSSSNNSPSGTTTG